MRKMPKLLVTAFFVVAALASSASRSVAKPSVGGGVTIADACDVCYGRQGTCYSCCICAGDSPQSCASTC